jgi:hypothetical protein
MKKTFFMLALVAAALQLSAQDDEDIVYFEDSDVRQSRMSIALLANPNFTNRNLINDEIPQGGGFDLLVAETQGSFAFNYNLDVFYTLSSALDIGIGFGRANAAYNISEVLVYESDSFVYTPVDTINVGADISTNMWTLPIKLNFNTSISDIFDLEVIPMVSLIFPDKYNMTLSSPDLQPVDLDLSDFLRNLNWRVGISLGGTWYFSENWGFFLRANANYLLNSMIERDGYPRETLYSFGADVGLKFHLF